MKSDKPLILIADDNRENVKLLSELLMKANNQVIIASDGEEALYLLEDASIRDNVDLILLDIMMPKKNGYETCKAIKSNPDTNNIPIIFITALHDISDKLKGLNLGAVDYITKPFRIEEILARVNIHLKIQSLTKQLESKNQELKAEIESRTKIESALWETQETLSTLITNIPGVVYRCQNNQQWTMEWISDNVDVLIGYPQAAFMISHQVSLGQLIHPEDQAKKWQIVQEAIQQQKNFQIDYRITTADGTVKWFWEKGRGIFLDNGELCALVGFIADITEEKQTKAALAHQLEKALLLKQITQEIRASLDSREIIDTAVQKIGQAFQVNRCKIHGYIPGEIPKIPSVAEYLEPGYPSTLDIEIPVIHNPFAQLVLAEDRAVAIDNVRENEFFAGLEALVEIFNVKSMLTVRTSYQNQPNGMICIQQCDRIRHWTEEDIDLFEALANQMGIALDHAKWLEKEKQQKIELEKRNLNLQKIETQLLENNRILEKLATIDGLTGVANRRQFDQCIEYEWKRLRRDKLPLSLILCDVDYFKSYNDIYGHLAGDDCLKKVAQAIQIVINRPGDLVARYGGEEFVVILPNTTMDGSIRVAQRIQEQIKQMKIVHKVSSTGYLTISLGISSIIPSQNKDPETLIRYADQALYQAKAQGRNQIITYPMILLLENKDYLSLEKTTQ